MFSLEKFRAKPDGVKRVIAFLGACAGVVLILLLWLAFNSLASSSKNISEENKNYFGPTAIIKDTVLNFYETFKQKSK